MRAPPFTVFVLDLAMPIRFRCAYCNQLMGIATRKAGTVITCPKCAGQVVVPKPDPDSLPDEPPSKGQHELLEDEELAQLLEMSQEEASQHSLAIPTAAKAHSSVASRSAKPHERTVRATEATLRNGEASLEATPMLAPATRGFFLPMPIFYLLNLGAVFLLVMTFFAGYWLGRSSAPAVPVLEKADHK
jgi:hypothetical protein